MRANLYMFYNTSQSISIIIIERIEVKKNYYIYIIQKTDK